MVTTFDVRLATIGPLGAADFATDAEGRPFQVCRAAVRTPDGEVRVALYWAFPTPLPLAALPPAMRNPPGVVAAVVRESSEGRAAVEVDPADEAHAPAVAAAAAVMRASWAWDESAAIAVTVNGMRVMLAPRFTGEVWQTVEIPPESADSS